MSRAAREPADDFSFLLGIRRRIQMAGQGPRAMALNGHQAWVASYFTDAVERVDLDAGVVTCLRAAVPHALGESVFNDGSISFQGWLSCASCQGPDARVDGLNWDLLNDGIGDPINTKSLLLAHRTPPSMSHAVRENAEAAVRAGLEHISLRRATGKRSGSPRCVPEIAHPVDQSLPGGRQAFDIRAAR
jgi:hypothetical protein